jgi:hypothetical protein
MDETRTRELLASLDSVQAKPDDEFVEVLRRHVHDIASYGADTTPGDDSRKDRLMVTLQAEPEIDSATSGPRPWRRLAAAAAVALVVGGGVAALLLSGDDDAPDRVADDPSPTESSVETDATEQSAEQAALVAEQFIAAGDAADVEASLALIGPEAQLTVGSNVVDPEETENWIRLEGVLGFRDEETVCSASDSTQVECSTMRSNRWTDATGGEPEPNTFFLRIEEGQVTAMRSTAAVDGWEEYFEFVMEQSNDEEFAAMFVSHPDGMGIIGLAHTDESIELHSHWTDKFEAAQGD